MQQCREEGADGRQINAPLCRESEELDQADTPAHAVSPFCSAAALLGLQRGAPPCIKSGAARRTPAFGLVLVPERWTLRLRP